MKDAFELIASSHQGGRRQANPETCHIPVPESSHREGFTRPGPFLFDLLASIGLKAETLGMMLDLMDKAKTLLADEDAQQGSRLLSLLPYRHHPNHLKHSVVS